jgi:hypothetical protein
MYLRKNTRVFDQEDIQIFSLKLKPAGISSAHRYECKKE